MSSSAYFVQECPTCGRRLQIRVEYLGKKVICTHCRGRLEARDPASWSGAPVEPSSAIMRRAEELLQHSTDTAAGQRVANPR